MNVSLSKLWFGMLLACLACLIGSPLRADQPARDYQVLAEKIDRDLLASIEAAKVTPAPLADDAEFLRRVYLDIAGRVPSVAEARAFLRD